MAPMDLMGGGRSGSPLTAKAPKSPFDQATGRWRLQVIPPLHCLPSTHVLFKTRRVAVLAAMGECCIAHHCKLLLSDVDWDQSEVAIALSLKCSLLAIARGGRQQWHPDGIRMLC